MAITTEKPQPRAAATETKADDPRVLAIVVTHRGRPWIRECVIALASQTYPQLDVLVVDDCSPDHRDEPTLRRLVKRHLRRRRWGLLRTPRPLGFGGAINWALSRIRTRADLLLFVHDDAALDEDALRRMVERIQTDDRIAIVGPKIVSWDDRNRLEEVGMSIDRFGYPYKGLEEGEIDLGQHDQSTEVFFVTSTCMLIRQEVFRALRGWDVRMRAFSEDLDLCWRARIAGHSVQVEPSARARHAIALARGLRESPYRPVRYFGRRNRLRAVAKNVSGPRLALLLPQFVLVTFAEMLGFVVLRQPREISHLARALGWNFLRFPQTLRERARVQRTRRVTDRSLNRFAVRQTTRVRSYITHQAGRLEEAWGRRAEVVARHTSQARAFSARSWRWPAAAAVAVAVALLLALRNLLWSPPSVVGELLPFPDTATGLWNTFFSSWHAAGLGQPGPSPPAFLLLGIFPLVTFGAAGAAQKLLVVTLGAAGFVGAYRLVSYLVDRPARVVTGLVYALGAVGLAGVRGGDLSALVFGAAAPFALHSLLRIAGWVRPAGWGPGREAARLGVTAAFSAAFVPGSLIMYALAALALCTTRLAFAGPISVLASLASSLGSVAIGWVLLLPWASTWDDPGGVFWRLAVDDSWRYVASGFSRHSMLSVLLGQTPAGPALAGLALPLLGVVAAAIGFGQRRRVALALWAVIAVSGVATSAIASASVRPFLVSPIEAGVLPSLAFSALAGLALSAFRVDLPRRGLGWIHFASVGALALAGLLLAIGLVPAILRGAWSPGGDAGAQTAAQAATIRSFLTSQAREEGQFRTLWVGPKWVAGAPSALRPMRPWLVTGVQGQSIRDLFDRSEGAGEEALASIVASIAEGTTDRGGRLLGVFNIHYVVLQPGEANDEWLSQRDLALTRTEPGYMLLENAVKLPRAGIYTKVPVAVHALEAHDPAFASRPVEVQRVPAARRGASRYQIDGASGPGAVFLAESKDDGWSAAIGDVELERVDGGWGNAFSIPPDTHGELRIGHSRGLTDWLWLLLFGLAWVVVLGAALSRRPREPVLATRRAR